MAPEALAIRGHGSVRGEEHAGGGADAVPRWLSGLQIRRTPATFTDYEDNAHLALPRTDPDKFVV